MGKSVAITRLDLSADDLRCRAQRAGSIEAARRMLALALVLEERPRIEAARTCGMDRQTLRDWVHRYNAEGLRGLSDRKPPGGIPKLTAEQEAEVAARAGRDLAEDGGGAARISRRASSGGSASCWPSVVSARCSSVWLSGTSRSDHSIRNRTYKPLRRIKKTSPLW